MASTKQNRFFSTLRKYVFCHVSAQILLLCFVGLVACLRIEAQNARRTVGGACDGCELMYSGMPRTLSSVDTSAGWYEAGRKLLLTGKVYRLDGKTPAANVILYYWHTDNNGYYSPRANMDVRAKRHGHIRGWIKTDAEGNYALYTIRPQAYPDRSEPEHIHILVKEPDIADEYYIDDIVFDDDPLLLPILKRRPPQKRGGSGIVRILLSGNLQIAEHNIILGLNIPNYPAQKTIRSRSENVTPFRSGLSVGDDSPSFLPFHAWGPDANTRACPVCKYGRFHGIEYFVGNRPNWDEIRQWLVFLEAESKKRSPELKVYFVYGNETRYSADERRQQLAGMGKELGITKTALAFVPSLNDQESEVYLNKIHPEAENTFIIYKHRTIVDTFVNLKPTSANFTRIVKALARTKGKYFHLSTPAYH